MKGLFFSGLLALLSTPFATASTPHEDVLQLAASGNGLIKLNAQTYELLTSPKRTWSASIQFTAMDAKRKCAPCAQFDPQWKAVAKSWRGVPVKQRDEHFFATVDFDDAPTIFQKLGLASAPIVFNYPAAAGERKPASGKTGPIKYDFGDGFDAGPLAEVISKFTPIPVPYKEPIDWTKASLAIVAIPAVLLLLRYLGPVVQNRWVWAVGTILTSLVMTSGYMFVRIRAAPWNGGGGNWIAAGHQNQYGQEVQVIAFIYGLLSFSFLMLIMVVPYQKSPSRQRIQIYLWTGVIMIMYSVLVSIFRVKNRGYPFKLWL
ncbi:oligosaccharyl transferase subunit OST3/OST6 family [Crepidotus variabilis]|uniref:Oligosaccharyl transferase subunit OST3/OST6 family n=1 Tax=Crepidotus variabilis TaxID=179855 RepID=A0A9P6EPY6_9AGAR|nr:oligosaccharyl transferase subunit OST3/OST6 family [Crepidotus variabilis]